MRTTQLTDNDSPTIEFQGRFEIEVCDARRLLNGLSVRSRVIAGAVSFCTPIQAGDRYACNFPVMANCADRVEPPMRAEAIERLRC
ncbi:MAG: hypothetical protein J7641_12980 [Cyanobacteria bacterium SID2]|nr:hypothetical protein [Cyanobacteria bacterium SID2]MBP0004925.1 hypothetical protein [Cyanobacteria bacterium SBC]